MAFIVKKLSQKAGLAPGTAVYVGQQKVDSVSIVSIDYSKDIHVVRELSSKDDFEALVNNRMPLSNRWLDITGLHDPAFIENIGVAYGLHSLTIEDILNTEMRPKVEIFDTYIFISLKMLTYDTILNKVVLEQVSIVVDDGVVITFQERPGDVFDPIRKRLKDHKGRIRSASPDYLAYALLDGIVDAYFTVLEQVGENLERLEDELLVDPQPATFQKIHSLKRDVILLRRSVWPVREIVAKLSLEDTVFLKEKTEAYMRNLYDHIAQVIDTTETIKEVVTGVLDIYLSTMSNKMNEIMKVLTIFAAIFIPLTFIAGVYGMNFNPTSSPFNMPELHWYFGYPFALGIMAAVAGSMLFYFKKKRWI